MTLSEFITYLEDEIAYLENIEENFHPLDCCDNRELKALQDTLHTARQINGN